MMQRLRVPRHDVEPIAMRLEEPRRPPRAKATERHPAGWRTRTPATPPGGRAPRRECLRARRRPTSAP
eukprot:7810519-Pyramimonas_sp.AAC.1